MTATLITMTFIVSFLSTMILGPIFIGLFKKLKFGQIVRDDGPETHIKKMGTPTVGGVIFLIPMIIISLSLKEEYPQIIPIMIATAGFGLVGFIDDMSKIIKHSKNGISASMKMALLFIVAIVFSFYIVRYTDIGTELKIPLIGTVSSLWIFVAFSVFVLLAMTNAANLTDGVDGLAGGIAFIIFMFFFAVALLNPTYDYIRVFSAILMGGILGFLYFNSNPARLFMGDTGSLALGGALGSIAIVMKMPFVILIVGAIYVLECLSVIIQVAWFKKTGKRVFRMAPLHHHFELGGWSEKKVVAVFYIVTLLLCAISYWLILIQVF